MDGVIELKSRGGRLTGPALPRFWNGKAKGKSRRVNTTPIGWLGQALAPSFDPGMAQVGPCQILLG